MLICKFPVTLKPWHSLCISNNLLKLIIQCGLVDVPYTNATSPANMFV